MPRRVTAPSTRPEYAGSNPVSPSSPTKVVLPFPASWGEPSVLVTPVRNDSSFQHVVLGHSEVSSALVRMWRKVQLCFVVQRRSALHVHFQGLLRRLLPAGLSPITLWRGGNTASQGTNRQEEPAGGGDRFVRRISNFCTCSKQVKQELNELPCVWFDVCVLRNYKSSWW